MNYSDHSPSVVRPHMCTTSPLKVLSQFSSNFMPVVYSTDRSKPFQGGGPGVSLTLCCFVVYSTRRFVLCLTLCHFVLVFISPFSIAITSLGEERANRSAFRTYVRFVLVWIYRFPLPLGVWEGLRFFIVALPGLFSYLFFFFFFFFFSCGAFCQRGIGNL